MLTTAHWVVVAVTAGAVVVCVLLHYEALRFMASRLPKFPSQYRRLGVAWLILFLLLVHIAEIWVFGFANFVLLPYETYGRLEGVAGATLLDCVYYSAAVFTTLGFGDIVPKGPIRFLTGTEAITGLTLIGWSASFTYLTMSRAWDGTGR